MTTIQMQRETKVSSSHMNPIKGGLIVAKRPTKIATRKGSPHPGLRQTRRVTKKEQNNEQAPLLKGEIQVQPRLAQEVQHRQKSKTPRIKQWQRCACGRLYRLRTGLCSCVDAKVSPKQNKQNEPKRSEMVPWNRRIEPTDSGEFNDCTSLKGPSQAPPVLQTTAKPIAPTTLKMTMPSKAPVLKTETTMIRSDHLKENTRDGNVRMKLLLSRGPTKSLAATATTIRSIFSAGSNTRAITNTWARTLRERLRGKSRHLTTLESHVTATTLETTRCSRACHPSAQRTDPIVATSRVSSQHGNTTTNTLRTTLHKDRRKRARKRVQTSIKQQAIKTRGTYDIASKSQFLLMPMSLHWWPKMRRRSRRVKLIRSIPWYGSTYTKSILPFGISRYKVRVMMTMWRLRVTRLTSWYECTYTQGISPYGISRYKRQGYVVSVSRVSAFLGVHTARPPG